MVETTTSRNNTHPAVHNLFVQFLLIPGLERRLASEHFKQQGAQAPPIYRLCAHVCKEGRKERAGIHELSTIVQSDTRRKGGGGGGGRRITSNKGKVQRSSGRCQGIGKRKEEDNTASLGWRDIISGPFRSRAWQASQAPCTRSCRRWCECWCHHPKHQLSTAHNLSNGCGHHGPAARFRASNHCLAGA